jgi:AraC-like DNA-binding protein
MKTSTDNVEPAERFDYWREIVCSRFVRLAVDIPDRRQFSGSLDARQLGEIPFTVVTASEQHVKRTPSQIGASHGDNFMLSLQLVGRGVHKQDGRVAALRPGDFVLFDQARPYDLLFGERFSQLVLTLPRELAMRRMPDLTHLTARRVDGRAGSGRLASLFMRQLARQLDTLDASSIPRLQASTLELIVTALIEQHSAEAHRLSRTRNVLLQEILQYIEDHLDDSTLSCATVAQSHRISDRTLRNLFGDLGTCASDWIWQRRLERARIDLCDPGFADRSVAFIGYQWGFKSSAHFGRAFKAKFGVSPGDLRPRPTTQP